MSLERNGLVGVWLCFRLDCVPPAVGSWRRGGQRARRDFQEPPGEPWSLHVPHVARGAHSGETPVQAVGKSLFCKQTSVFIVKESIANHLYNKELFRNANV